MKGRLERDPYTGKTTWVEQKSTTEDKVIKAICWAFVIGVTIYTLANGYASGYTPAGCYC